MSADSVIAIAWDVLKSYVVVPIKRRFNYVISSKSFADCLREEVRNLENEAQRVRILAEVARNNLRNFYDDFTEWQQNANEALEEAGDLLGDFEKATKTCCYGTLPDPKCRYQFSRKAEGRIGVIKQLAQKCRGFKELNDISFSNPAPGDVTAPNPARREGKGVVQSTTATASASSASTSNELSDDGLFKSRAAIIRDIMVALADHSNSVVGIHGMGGLGKSTLLVDAERRIREEKQFDLIAKADVSQNPDIKMIQGVIAHALGLDMKGYDYESVRADRLRERLGNEKKKVLIILDNLWEGLDLKSVGIPCGHDNKVMGCKLLLTSRDRNVLQREMGCDRDFFLNRLEEKEAKILFERIMGEKVHNDEFRPLVDEALRKCAGLPLLIVTMAKHFKDATPPEWRDALNQIGRSTNKGISAVINTSLQLSYDHLASEEAKSLLQLCVAYGVSNPSVENLVRYSYGLGIFPKESSMKEARDGLRTLICTLQASSLLLDNGGAYGFKIHDLVRDFVAQFILRDRPLLLLKDKDMLATQLQKERLKSCMAICFPYIDMKELPEELDCPELRIFLLFTNNESLEVPDSYFNSMKKLAVLNLTRVRLTRSPTPFQFLENLHTLCFHSCSLEDVAILGELKGLQILSFVNSKIQRLPKEIGQLVELRLLDLNSCPELQIIEPGVLGSLIKLEELYMENSFHQWNAVEQTPRTNASLIELNHMKNLCTLHVSIPDLSVLPGDLNIEKLTEYKIQIGHLIDFHLWRGLSNYKGSRTLELKLNPTNDILHKGCIRTTLHIIDDLWLDGLNGIEQSICQLSPEGFPQLKRLHVQESPSIRYILKWSSLPTFKTLEFLFLRNLINLEKLCHNDISSKSFSALKVLRVDSCDKMEHLFPLSLLRELPQLKEIEVVSCKVMKGIVKDDDCGQVELRNLHVLKLRDLPSIKNFVVVGTAPSSSTSDDQVGTQLAFFNMQQALVSNF
ncbi:probable disease resistance protein At4g27220 [Syzygium oleosum]|uniref:probable disease resistance protein At4g27220 n=1 Tax=Syzygium oleosum TaxID=219896 RepID=UPI0024BB2F77|nr:probable disease resistance protein At4g27220 [Syzygium oleosum]